MFVEHRIAYTCGMEKLAGQFLLHTDYTCSYKSPDPRMLCGRFKATRDVHNFYL